MKIINIIAIVGFTAGKNDSSGKSIIVHCYVPISSEITIILVLKCSVRQNHRHSKLDIK